MGRVERRVEHACPVVNVLPVIVRGIGDTLFDLTLRIKRDLKKIRKTNQKYNGETNCRDLSRVGAALYGPTLNLRIIWTMTFHSVMPPATIGSTLQAGPVEDLGFWNAL